VDIASSEAHCGACGRRCVPPEGAAASCVNAMCSWQCSAGFDRVGERCELRVSRPIAPLSASRVTAQRPTLRWSLPTGVSDVELELCSKRSCRPSEVLQSARVSGGEWRSATELRAGVYFWRVRSASGTTRSAVSATWTFFVGRRDSAYDGAWSVIPDFNGDGFADVAVRSARGVVVYWGSVSGLIGSPQVLAPVAGLTGFGAPISLGDLNGDGFGDIGVVADNATLPGSSGRGVVAVFLGGDGGLSAAPAVVIGGRDGVNGFGQAATKPLPRRAS
jgi:hypothetical protein